MSFLKYAKLNILESTDQYQICQSWIGDSFIKTASEEIELDDTKYFYTRARAVSCLEKFGPNDNYDGFEKKTIQDRAHTFKDAGVYFNHNNDDPRKAFGKIIAYAIKPDDDTCDFVEVIMAHERGIPKDEFHAYESDEIISMIKTHQLTDVSMGALVEESICSICDVSAKTPEELCPLHIGSRGDLKGREYNWNGTMKLAFEINRGVTWFEVSDIPPWENGADRDAKIAEIVLGSLIGYTGSTVYKKVKFLKNNTVSKIGALEDSNRNTINDSKEGDLDMGKEETKKMAYKPEGDVGKGEEVTGQPNPSYVNPGDYPHKPTEWTDKVVTQMRGKAPLSEIPNQPENISAKDYGEYIRGEAIKRLSKLGNDQLAGLLTVIGAGAVGEEAAPIVGGAPEEIIDNVQDEKEIKHENVTKTDHPHRHSFEDVEKVEEEAKAASKTPGFFEGIANAIKHALNPQLETAEELEKQSVKMQDFKAKKAEILDEMDSLKSKLTGFNTPQRVDEINGVMDDLREEVMVLNAKISATQTKMAKMIKRAQNPNIEKDFGGNPMQGMQDKGDYGSSQDYYKADKSSYDKRADATESDVKKQRDAGIQLDAYDKLRSIEGRISPRLAKKLAEIKAKRVAQQKAEPTKEVTASEKLQALRKRRARRLALRKKIAEFKAKSKGAVVESKESKFKNEADYIKQRMSEGVPFDKAQDEYDKIKISRRVRIKRSIADSEGKDIEAGEAVGIVGTGEQGVVSGTVTDPGTGEEQVIVNVKGEERRIPGTEVNVSTSRKERIRKAIEAAKAKRIASKKVADITAPAPEGSDLRDAIKEDAVKAIVSEVLNPANAPVTAPVAPEVAAPAEEKTVKIPMPDTSVPVEEAKAASLQDQAYKAILDNKMFDFEKDAGEYKHDVDNIPAASAEVAESENKAQKASFKKEQEGQWRGSRRIKRVEGKDASDTNLSESTKPLVDKSNKDQEAELKEELKAEAKSADITGKDTKDVASTENKDQESSFKDELKKEESADAKDPKGKIDPQTLIPKMSKEIQGLRDKVSELEREKSIRIRTVAVKDLIDKMYVKGMVKTEDELKAKVGELLSCTDDEFKKISAVVDSVPDKPVFVKKPERVSQKEGTLKTPVVASSEQKFEEISLFSEDYYDMVSGGDSR